MDTTSQADFIDWWSAKVATQFGFEEATIKALYDREHDTHNT